MAGIGKNGQTDLFAASHLVCYWHKADIPVALTNVRFWG
jgi:hypothetical protein